MPVFIFEWLSVDLLEKKIVDIAARCVSCGLCLPHCPTYRKTLDEADSPRGRIMLISGAARGDFVTDKSALRHIDLCLACRACESVCPNGVAYGELVEIARESNLERGLRSVRWLKRMVLFAVATPRHFERIFTLLRFVAATGVKKMSGRLGLPGAMSLALGRRWGTRSVWQKSYQPDVPVRGRVGLFLGCVARSLDETTLRASVYVLNALGYSVVVPADQGCCGALFASQGERNLAGDLARHNARTFEEGGCEVVVVTASGCVSSLKNVVADNASLEYREICEFINSRESLAGIRVNPLPVTVVVHEPCSLRNSVHGQSAQYALLSRIPGVRLKPLAGNEFCCGAAGIYHLRHPGVAKMLVEDKVAAAKESESDVLVTTNFGCGLHIGGALAPAGGATEIVHPVVLLARQMGFDG